MRRWLCGLVTGGIVLALMGAGAAGGAFPGANGRIAFVRGAVIETISPDDTGAATLVAGALDPAWSPDGRRIAYSRACRIYVAAADASGARALTPGRQCDREPAWSPGGDRLVFTRRLASRRNAEASALYLIGAEGSGVRRLTQRSLTARRLRAPRNWADDSGPAWSAGDVIAFARGTATQFETIYVVRPDGGGLRRVVPPLSSSPQSQPAWSPDGRTIAYTRRGGRLGPTVEVRLVAPDGTGDRSLTEAVGNVSSPAWSPDGEYVCVYASHPDVAPNNLVILRRDGALVRIMRNAPGNAPDWQPLPTG